MLEKDDMTYVFVTSAKPALIGLYYFNIIQLVKDAETDEIFTTYLPKAFGKKEDDLNSGSMFLVLYDDFIFMKLKVGIELF